jgi:hypothetical protein
MQKSPPPKITPEYVPGDRKGASLWRIRRSVDEIVKMFPLFYLDRHRATKSGELAGGRIRHDRNTQLRHSARHGASVHEDKCSFPSVKKPAHPFYRDVAGRPFHFAHGAEHFTFAGSVQVTLEVLVNGHAAEICAFGFGFLRHEVNFKRSAGMIGHLAILSEASLVLSSAKYNLQMDPHDWKNATTIIRG